MACIHSKTENYSLLEKMPLPWDSNGELFYYVHNFTTKLSDEEQGNEINAAFDDWNYHLYRFRKSIKRTADPVKAFVHIWFVGGDTGELPIDQYRHIMADPDMIAFWCSGTGLIYINDAVDYKEISLAAALTHEFGHTQGIAHTDQPKDIMYAAYIPGNHITQDTINAINRIYSNTIIRRLYQTSIVDLLAISLILYIIYKITNNHVF